MNGTPQAAGPLRRRLGRRACPGMTLIELLVVISILVLLVAAVAPRVQPLLAERELREAARQVAAYAAAAQSRAARRGRAAGIWLERSTGNPAASIDISLCEVPPPYAGDTLQAKAKLNGATVSFTGAFNLSSMVKPGDQIRFDNKGRYYQINSVSGSTCTISNISVGGGVAPPYPQTGTQGVPFQIFRRPVRSSTGGLMLPAAVCIDLGNSGMGQSGTFTTTGQQPIILLFQPDGTFSTIYQDGSPTPVNSSVHLLIGSISKVGAENRADMTNRWVSIGRQTGLVTVVENGPDTNGDGSSTLAESRVYVLQKQGMGGR